MIQIQELRNHVERLKGKRDQLTQSLVTEKDSVRFKNRDLKYHEQAKEIIRQVGLKTQEQLQYHVSDLTSLALESVFPNPYELKVEFIQRRNKTECDLYFVRDGNYINPIDAAGIGAVDVATFALRVASWSMALPKSRNTIILDEPFKHLKGQETNLRVLEMINEISKKLNIQVIMVSDERIPKEDIIATADRVFEVKLKNGKSKVTIL